MTIHLPKDVESSINAEVHCGHFASVDEAVAAAWRAYRSQQQPNQPEVEVSEAQTVPAHKPIWEVFQEISASVPDEVWDALPTDLSEQHDHYIYGTPKRPTE